MSSRPQEPEGQVPGARTESSSDDEGPATGAAIRAPVSPSASPLGTSRENETFQFEIELSDQELATAWVREHYARQGMLRFWMAPALLFFAVVVLVQATDNVPRIAAFLMLAWGAFTLARPFLMASQIVAQRRKRGGTRKVLVSLDASGLTITKDDKDVLFPWKDITAAGMRQDYVWYEIRGAQRAPIPKRLVEDVEALQRFFAKRTLWSKR